MTVEIPKRYDYATFESSVYKEWMEADSFSGVPDNRKNRFVVMMPLPNVTGALHVGHAMNNIMQDLFVRWHRMLGDNTLWMPGTDHAGIATQAVIEKRLFELEGKTRHDIGRDGLVAKIWEWKDEYQRRIVKQQQRMTCSCDWGRQRFTMDPVCTRATREAFFRLFRDRLIFRGDRLVNWDCQLQTAVSDDEVVYELVQSHFWHVRYPVIDPRKGEPEFVSVATTRPETMLGDTAVACHPDPAGELEKQSELLKERIGKAPKKDLPHLREMLEAIEDRRGRMISDLLILKDMAQRGAMVRLPLLNREIPLILDEWAKPDLGSGCVKITPAHDVNDYIVWNRHGDDIQIINILNPDGTFLNSNAGPYKDLDRFEARERVVADLQEQGYLEKTEDRQIEIGHSDRSKTPIEPYLSKQWFLRMGDVDGGILCGTGTRKEHRVSGLAQAAIDTTDRDYKSPSGRRLTFYPDHTRYGGTYRSWLAEKRDWCISRQLWWGHRIPIWHGRVKLEKLRQIRSVLSEADVEKYWLWICDENDEMYDSGEIGSLETDKQYDVYICLRDEDTDKKHAGPLEAEGLEQDPDVLDTWFSSALWPMSTLGWPDPETAEIDENQKILGKTGNGVDCLEYYYPGSCLITERGIITLWVARMVIMGLYFLGDVPFKDCFIHAIIQDGKGERMSKSKGNGIDPEDIIDTYGVDAMRYVLCGMQTGTQDIRLPVQAISPYTGEVVDLATAQHGRTIFTYICPGSGKEFDVLGTMEDLPSAKIISQRFEEGRAFCTKIWNAARFALMNLGTHTYAPVTLDQLQAEDRWILSRLSRVIREVSLQLEGYNSSSAIGAARDFFWSEFCDWYLEFIKPRFMVDSSASVARTVLAYVLDQLLRLLHPFVPVITEALWERINNQCPVRGIEKPLQKSKLLVSASWSKHVAEWEDQRLEGEFDLLQNLIRSIRDLRSRYNVPPKRLIQALVKADKSNADVLIRSEPLIKHMARLDSFDVGSDVQRPLAAVSQVIGEIEVFLDGLLDPEKERDRLSKQRIQLEKDIALVQSRLENRKFLDRAPAEIVEKEKRKLHDLEAELASVMKNIQDIRDA